VSSGEGSEDTGSTSAVGEGSSASSTDGEPAMCGVGVDTATKPTGTLVDGGETVELVPSGVRFAVPKSILETEFSTLLLDAAELEVAENGAGEWTTEYAAIANALFPFERCGAHFGDSTWPNTTSWFALWGRAYLFEAPVEDIEAAFSDAAVVVEHVGGSGPEVYQEIGGPWRKTAVGFDLWFGDYGGPAVVDLRLHDVGPFRLGFVFMYPESVGTIPDHRETIDELLASVCIPDADGGCCTVH